MMMMEHFSEKNLSLSPKMQGFPLLAGGGEALDESDPRGIRLLRLGGNFKELRLGEKLQGEQRVTKRHLYVKRVLF